MTASALDDAAATVLFDTIDKHLGIFRKPDMTEDDWKYWAITRVNFIQNFTREVPPAFWFQSLKVPSVTLLHTNFHFVVTSDLASTDRSVAGLLYETNKALSGFNEELSRQGAW